MSYVLLLVVVIVGLAMVFDQRRRAELREKAAPQKKEPVLTEDEAPTTATGRLRVQPVLRALKEPKANPQKPVKDRSEEEEEALPDPFASGIHKRPKK